MLFFPPRATEIPIVAVTLSLDSDLMVSVASVSDRRRYPMVIGVSRGISSMVTGQILATNDGGLWVHDALEYELRRSGLGVPRNAPQGDAGPTRLRIEVELLEASAAANSSHPGHVLLSAVLTLDGRVRFARRLVGTSAAHDDSGRSIDATESLAVALREALRPLVEAVGEVAEATDPGALAASR